MTVPDEVPHVDIPVEITEIRSSGERTIPFSVEEGPSFIEISHSVPGGPLRAIKTLEGDVYWEDLHPEEYKRESAKWD